MKLKKQNLLLLAGIVWGIAGFNITQIGFRSYVNYLSIQNIVISLIVFSFFWFMIFSKLVTKHTKRILHYQEEKQFFLKFFDMKSFIIMVIMMSGGISLRAFELWPTSWIAVFYSGLGCALFLAGILFLYQYKKQLSSGGSFMKKTFQLSVFYLVLSLIGGVFYREFTKYFAFEGTTSLAFIHVHLFALGTLLFLVLTLFCMNTNLAQEKQYKTFLITYNIALPFTVIMMIVRGVLEVQGTPLSSSVNAMIAGIAGLAHILLTITFIFLFIALKNVVNEIESKRS